MCKAVLASRRIHLPKVLSEAEVEHFRDRLCDVAERLFAEHGPEAVTVRQLASELGVSPMTPYRYFKDKDAMLAAVRARAFDRFAAAMEAAHAAYLEHGRSADSAYVDFALANPAAYKLMFDVNQPTFMDYPDLTRAMQRARATMSLGVDTNAIQHGQDVELLSHVIWAAMHGPIMLQLAGFLRPPLDARAVLYETMRTLLRGFQAKA
jgi:AcrR family transcriptional regulator